MGGEAKCFLETTKFGRKIVALFSIYFGLEDNKEKSWPTASNYKVIQEVFQLLNNNSRSYFWYHNSLFSSYFTECSSMYWIKNLFWHPVSKPNLRTFQSPCCILWQLSQKAELWIENASCGGTRSGICLSNYPTLCLTQCLKITQKCLIFTTLRAKRAMLIFASNVDLTLNFRAKTQYFSLAWKVKWDIFVIFLTTVTCHN